MLKLLKSGVVLALVCASSSNAAVLTEKFEAPFPAWESDWFGANSTARNCYGAGEGRGNNPDGLWIASDNSGRCNGEPFTVSFSAPFAASLTSFFMDVAAYAPTTLTIFDKSGATLFNTNVTLTAGAGTDPGNYVRYGTTSNNGIGGFSFSGPANGNTSIDNLEAITSGTGSVPEPAAWAMMIGGFGLIGAAARRRVRVTVRFA